MFKSCCQLILERYVPCGFQQIPATEQFYIFIAERSHILRESDLLAIGCIFLKPVSRIFVVVLFICGVYEG